MQIQWPEGIDTTIFLRDYWQQKPLLIRQAFADFESPIDANELAGLTLDTDANSRYMECVDGTEWRMTHGPFADDFYDGVTGKQWSILVSDVEKLLPEFRQYLQPFRFIPDWRIDDLMISYAPVGGSVGAHVDQYDVFLLQAAGQREWQIETTPRPHQTESASTSISLLADFAADASWQLVAGDMLYLPPRFAHHGIATEDPCMTWSIGFRAPSVDEMLPSVINYLLEDIPDPARFTDPSRPYTDAAGEISHTDLDTLRQLVRSALSAEDDRLDRAIGRYLTESINTEPQPENDSNTDTLPETLYCNSNYSFAYKTLGTEAELYTQGEAYHVSSELASTLCDTRSVTTATLSEADTQSVLQLYKRDALLAGDDGE